MQKDYKMFPPSVDWDNIDWSTRRPQMDFPVQVSLAYAAKNLFFPFLLIKLYFIKDGREKMQLRG